MGTSRQESLQAEMQKHEKNVLWSSPPLSANSLNEFDYGSR